MKKMILEAFSQNVPLSEVMRCATREYVQRHNEPCTSSEALRRSNTDIHTEVNPHRCGHCGKTYATKLALNRHERTHANERNETHPYQCDLCYKSYTTKSDLKRHKRTHTGNKPHVCKICGKAFCNKWDRDVHRFIHSDKRQFVCPVCGKDYKQSKGLYNHMRNKNHKGDIIVKNKPRLTME
ncbi:zinc finger protein 70-like [Mycetomoellerius zeteki]|uniref:zinc finger protein 70-like n=1 Tax=Mycetomoellerius zeteki TaxID=64791 RepID=UPI00084E44BF|nr:PREDICTED: zinc finger protein 70-like [Trachymyrmex zeteki]